MVVKVVVLHPCLVYLCLLVQPCCRIVEVLLKAMVWLDETQIDNLAVLVVRLEGIEVLFHARQRHLIWLVEDYFEGAILDPEEWQ